MKWICVFLFVKMIAADDVQQNGIRLPAEWEPQERTFMCWPQSAELWGDELLADVRLDIARIANVIVEFEPVVMLTDPKQVLDARKLLNPRVSVVAMELDDLWARDTLPMFVETKSNGTVDGLVGVMFNFNGWGNKQIHEKDAKVAENVVRMYELLGRTARIIAEGGAFETDGRGTLLVTESSLVNTNRNAQTKDEIEQELKSVLGMRKVIWFKGVKGEDITDAHVDCLVRFVKPGTVIVNRPFPGEPANVWSVSSDDALSVLKNSTDADGNGFEIIEMFEPDPTKIVIKGNPDTFLSSYANFFVANGCVIVPEFGDKDADLKAQKTLRELFTGRTVIPVQISALGSGGGGIHCATHDQPKIEPNH